MWQVVKPPIVAEYVKLYNTIYRAKKFKEKPDVFDQLSHLQKI